MVLWITFVRFMYCVEIGKMTMLVYVQEMMLDGKQGVCMIYVGRYEFDPNTIILNPNLIKVSWGLGMNYIKLFHPYEKVIKTQNSKVLVGNHTSNLHMMG